MFLVFFIFWLVLNAHFALDIAMLEIVLFGLVLSGLLYFFMIKFTKWTKEYDRLFLANLPLFIGYAFVLLWNIFTANFHVIGLIIKRHETVKPCIVRVKVGLKNELFRTMLANAITLTPGTITIHADEEAFTVHCLKHDYIEGIETSTLAKILMKLEAKMS